MKSRGDLRYPPLDQRQTALNSSRCQGVLSPEERGILIGVPASASFGSALRRRKREQLLVLLVVRFHASKSGLGAQKTPEKRQATITSQKDELLNYSSV